MSCWIDQPLLGVDMRYLQSLIGSCVALGLLLISESSPGLAREWEDIDLDQLEEVSEEKTTGTYPYLAVTAGSYHTLALRSDGVIYGSGRNSSGQLGVGTTTSSYKTPVKVSGLSSVKSISAGCSHSLALKSDGTVWSFGSNTRGQLGIGTTTSQTRPVRVSSLPAIAAISAGCDHSLALDTSGYVWAWGSNNIGQVGVGNYTNQLSPRKLNLIATSIDAGSDFNLALKADGTVWAWGNGSRGQLGRGGTTSSSVPVQSYIYNVLAVSAGKDHAIALDIDGYTLRAWGDNSTCELGTGSYSPPYSTTPVPVDTTNLWGIGPFEAGSDFTMLGSSDGFGPAFPGWQVVIWGAGAKGQLANGTNSDSCFGTFTSGGIAPIDATAKGAFGAGGAHSVIVNIIGVVDTAGYNGYGQLATGSYTSTNTFVPSLFP